MISRPTTTLLLASGSNAHGQLANNSLDDSHLFTPCYFRSTSDALSQALPPGTRISQLATGANHTVLALSHDDRPGVELWGCGDPSKGQLGPTLRAHTLTRVFQPLQIPAVQRDLEGYYPRLICAAWDTSFVVMTAQDGRSDVVLSMGANEWGDLGSGASGQAQPDIHVVRFDHLVNDRRESPEVSVLRVRSIAAGTHHLVVHLQATRSGAVRDFLTGWGITRHGQLGSVSGDKSPYTSIPRVVPIATDAADTTSIAAGYQHTVLLHASGKVSGFGSNKKGQLHNLETLGNVRAVGCTWNGTYALTYDRDDRTTVFSTGSYQNGQLGRANHGVSPARQHVQFPVAGLDGRRIQSIACGSEHVLCVVSRADGERDDEVWGWGWNEHGNLGTGTTEDVLLPRKIWLCPLGSTHTSGVPPPQPGHGQSRGHVQGVWAGCGTSWIAIQICPF